MLIKNKIVVISKKKLLLEKDLDLDLAILLFNESNDMLPIHIVHLSFENIM